jgi:NifB/MoaA-like Fe-S oxidoreductase
MVREFLSVFNRKRANLRNQEYQNKRAMFFTGHSAFPFLSADVLPFMRQDLGLNVALHPVTNQFWGESVTVSGLLTGQDLLREARKKLTEFDVLVLPPNCLNQDSLFLDNLSLTQFQAVLQKPVFIGQYDLAATIKDVFV